MKWNLFERGGAVVGLVSMPARVLINMFVRACLRACFIIIIATHHNNPTHQYGAVSFTTKVGAMSARNTRPTPPALISVAPASRMT